MPSDAMRVWREASVVALGSECGMPDCEECQAAAAVIERAIADAVAEREARIVEWLKRGDHEGAALRRLIWEAIERGDHKERQDG